MSTLIPYSKQSIDDSDIAAVAEVMRSPFLTRGPKLAEFEQAIAEYCGAEYAVAFNSATSGLTAACFAANVNSYDRLVTTPNTFIATVAAGMRWGAEPLFIDIDKTTGNLDLNLLQYNVHYPSSRGRNIYIPVHFAGIPIEIQKLERMIDDPDAVVIEDAAHALGSSYSDGNKVGSCAYSQMTVFSFHPVKNITCAEGGVVTTNDKNLYHRLLLYRSNGIEKEESYLVGKAAPWYYEVHELTGNFFMNELQAALGLSQLSRIETFAAKRRLLVAHYRKRLETVPHVTLLNPADLDQACMYHLCVTRIDFDACGLSRADVMEELKNRGIGTQVHYIPIYRHPFFTRTKRNLGPYFPEMEAFYAEELSLPLYPDLTTAEVDHVIDTLDAILQNKLSYYP